MRRKALAVLIGITVISAGLLTSCGTSRSARPGPSRSPSHEGPASGARSPSRLSATPSAGSPTTTFSLRFTAPAASGRVGGSRLGYTLSLTGPGAVECIGARSLPVPATTRNAPTQIELAPGRLGGRWCAGTYTTRVVELETPVCAPGTMCPQFVRLVGTVATARFRVKR